MERLTADNQQASNRSTYGVTSQCHHAGIVRILDNRWALMQPHIYPSPSIRPPCSSSINIETLNRNTNLLSIVTPVRPSGLNADDADSANRAHPHGCYRAVREPVVLGCTGLERFAIHAEVRKENGSLRKRKLPANNHRAIHSSREERAGGGAGVIVGVVLLHTPVASPIATMQACKRI